MSDEIVRTHDNLGEDYANQEKKEVSVSEVVSQELQPGHFYHRDPCYRPWLRSPGPRKPTPHEEILAMMARYLNCAVLASKGTLMFSIIIALDFMLPKSPKELEVTGYNTSLGGTIQVELNDGSVINISKKAMRKMRSKSLTVSRTRLFSVPYRISDKQNNTASIEISIYGNFIFMPLVLLATSLAGVWYKKGFELRFNLGVASFFLALLNIAFLHVHKF